MTDVSGELVRIVGTCSWCGRWIYSNQEWAESYTPYTGSVITGLATVRLWHKGSCNRYPTYAPP